MKKTILLFIVQIVFCFSLKAQNQSKNYPFNEKDSIQISGKIVGYQPSQEDHFITFSAHDLSGRTINQSIQIENNGTFWVRLYQPYDGDIEMSYRDVYLNLYAKAGVPLIIEIQNDKILEQTDFEKAFIVKGQLAEVNNLLFKFETEMAKQNFVSIDFDKGQSDSLFASKCLNMLSKKQQFLKSFIAQNRIKNQLFIEWQSNQLQYIAGKDILFYPFLGKLNTQISQEQLLTFVKPILINNTTAFHNSSYYYFLNNLMGNQQIIININPFYEAIKKKNNGNTVGTALDLIDSYAVDLTREVLYCLNFKRKASFAADPNLFLTRFNQVVTTPFLKQYISPSSIDTKSFKVYNIADRLQESKIELHLKQRLIKLFNAYKGTNVYIDFWGDWCGPCMSELPSYPGLISSLVGKPIKFLFLSTFTTEESMLAIKKKFKIDGDFINLSKDETAIVNNVFEFHSYPSHFMVSDEGEVISKMSKNSLDNVQQKAEEITRLLKK